MLQIWTKKVDKMKKKHEDEENKGQNTTSNGKCFFSFLKFDID
jgi:hypothetical protein